MDIKINRHTKVAEVIKNNVVIKTQTLEDDSLRTTMKELIDKAEMDIDVVRKYTKLFKVSSFNFKGII